MLDVCYQVKDEKNISDKKKTFKKSRVSCLNQKPSTFENLISFNRKPLEIEIWNILDEKPLEFEIWIILDEKPLEIEK